MNNIEVSRASDCHMLRTMNYRLVKCPYGVHSTHNFPAYSHGPKNLRGLMHLIYVMIMIMIMQDEENPNDILCIAEEGNYESWNF